MQHSRLRDGFQAWLNALLHTRKMSICYLRSRSENSRNARNKESQPFVSLQPTRALPRLSLPIVSCNVITSGTAYANALVAEEPQHAPPTLDHQRRRGYPEGGGGGGEEAGLEVLHAFCAFDPQVSAAFLQWQGPPCGGAVAQSAFVLCPGQGLRAPVKHQEVHCWVFLHAVRSGNPLSSSFQVETENWHGGVALQPPAS